MRHTTWLCGIALALAPAARAADAGPIQQAVDRGVAYLKQLQRPDGRMPAGEVGATALAGLTFLECGVPATDPAVQRAAEVVRQSSISLTHTYSLALAVLFLDRLGEDGDVPFLESMTVRLLAGQNAAGGWDYQCPAIDESEVRRLTTLLKQRNELVAKTEPPKKPDEKRPERKLTSEIQKQLEQIQREKAAQRFGDKAGRDDNSNTQFAILALWVARRHGLPADLALARVDARFRTSQNADGGWDYSYHPAKSGGRHNGTSTATMTCAGLLGLAVAHGAAVEAVLRTNPQKDPSKPAQPALDLTRDPAVRDGLIALSTAIDHPVAKKKGKAPIPVMDDGGKAYYFFWSLERVAVAFGLPTIGNKDWYGWGAEVLVANQRKDGSWQGSYAQHGADTCFALLFLRRANLARDLTTTLKGKIQDPGEVVLKGGGVGGDALKERLGLKPALDPAERAGESGRPKTGPEAEAAKLGRELVKAEGARRRELLGQLREGKGGEYTQALAAAVHQLDGDARKQGREALAERLSRMTTATLKDKLQDGDYEVRRAAAVACAMKEDKTHVPRLIELIDDPEPAVVSGARAALKSLTGEDFGPPADAGRAERTRAAAAWLAWWQRQQGK